MLMILCALILLVPALAFGAEVARAGGADASIPSWVAGVAAVMVSTLSIPAVKAFLLEGRRPWTQKFIASALTGLVGTAAALVAGGMGWQDALVTGGLSAILAEAGYQWGPRGIVRAVRERVAAPAPTDDPPSA